MSVTGVQNVGTTDKMDWGEVQRTMNKLYRTGVQNVQNELTRCPKWEARFAGVKRGKGSLPMQSMVSILSLKSIVRLPKNRNVTSA